MPDIIDVDFDDDDDDDDDEFYRNARVRSRRAIVVRGRPRGRSMTSRGGGRSPIVHKYGNLKWGLIADAGAKAVAAIQPLPDAPRMGTDATKNMQDLADYHEALAQHAKRSQQLTTLGSIAKVFLP